MSCNSWCYTCELPVIAVHYHAIFCPVAPIIIHSSILAAILLSIIYIEICQRLGITIVGSCVGEDFLIWPDSGNLEVGLPLDELFLMNIAALLCLSTTKRIQTF